MTSNPVKVNYLANKDILEEIYKTKMSFCRVEDPKYARYDAIIHSTDEMFDKKIIKNAKEARAARLANDAYLIALNAFKSVQKPDNSKTIVGVKPKADSFKVDVKTISTMDLVFRYVTWEHIPIQDGRKKNPKKTADLHTKLTFIPFKHLIIDDLSEKTYKEVVTSHWKNGVFDLECGKISPGLAKMFLLLVTRYAQRSNWRSYTYVEEMKGQSLVQLAATGLLFNEEKSANPFSYLTAIVTNSFRSILNNEKKQQSLRDDLLQEYGKNPSYTRQLEHETEVKRMREDLESHLNNDT